MRYFYVYRITCTHPDSQEKYYYGHRTSKLMPEKDNYWSSSTYIRAAMAKYGKSFFTKKVVRSCDTREEAMKLEADLHEKFSVDTHPLFFNKSKQAMWGYNCTGAVLKGRTYEDIHGVERGAELRELRRQKTKGKDNKGNKNPMFKKHHSLGAKQLMSKARAGKTFPNHKWITDGIENKKIDITTTPLEAGWRYGRTCQWRKANQHTSLNLSAQNDAANAAGFSIASIPQVPLM